MLANNPVIKRPLSTGNLPITNHQTPIVNCCWCTSSNPPISIRPIDIPNFNINLTSTNMDNWVELNRAIFKWQTDLVSSRFFAELYSAPFFRHPPQIHWQPAIFSTLHSINILICFNPYSNRHTPMVEWYSVQYQTKISHLQQQHHQSLLLVCFNQLFSPISCPLRSSLEIYLKLPSFILSLAVKLTYSYQEPTL